MRRRKRKRRSGRDTLPLCSELPGLPQPGRDTRWCLLPSPGSSEEGCSGTANHSSLPPSSCRCPACQRGYCWGKPAAGKPGGDRDERAAHCHASPGSPPLKHGAVPDPDAPDHGEPPPDPEKPPRAVAAPEPGTAPRLLPKARAHQEQIESDTARSAPAPLPAALLLPLLQ